MASRDNSAEERIILATISCIEREGIQKLTIRSIAKEAGVNSAAISYYFRSKDILVARVMETTLDHLFEDLAALVDDENLGPEERVAEILDYLIDGATRYPGITRAHLYASMSGETLDDPFATRMNDILTKLRQKLVGRREGRVAPAGGRELDLRLVSLFSSALLPAIMPGFYREFSGIDFRDSRTRKDYVRAIMGEFRAG